MKAAPFVMAALLTTSSAVVVGAEIQAPIPAAPAPAPTQAARIPAPATSGTEIWICKYDGSFTERETSEGTQPFQWVLTWQAAGDDTWALAGTTQDTYGVSTITGRCSAKGKCTMDQRYTSGSLGGKSYFWIADENEEPVDASTVKHGFLGTWGWSRGDRQSGGNWKADALCNKMP